MTELHSTGASPFLTESRFDAPAEEKLVANVPTLEELERVHIRYVLERVRWHQGRAAAVLGISSKTLYRKIRQYGFKRPHVTAPLDR